MSDLGLWGPGASVAWWPIAIGAIVNTSCALLGCFLVLRRLSLLGDAISHAVLPGIVAAFLLAGGFSAPMLLVGAMLSGLVTSLLIESLHRYGGVSEDVGMGVVALALFSIGVLILTRFAGDAHIDTACVLYGDIEFLPHVRFYFAGLSLPTVLPTMIAALVGVLLFITLFWKELKLAAFDPALATASGFSATLMHYLLLTMTAVVTVAGFKAVGSVLIVAMLIVPPATASLLTDRLGRMLCWAAACAVSASFFGVVLAEQFSGNVGGMSAVVAGIQFGLAVLFAPRHGVLSKAWTALQLRIRILGEDLAAALFRDEEAGVRRTGEGIAARELLQRTGGGTVARWALRRLLRRGDLSTVGGDRVALTNQGRAAAESLVRSHRLWEAYLVEHFQLPLDHLHAPAERIEHFIGPELQRELAESLPKSDVDPHGREIPPPRESSG